MPGMSVKEVHTLARHVEKQGVAVVRKTDGYVFRLPNGDTCNVHFTSSDVNQRNTIRLLLKRGGITLPEAEEPRKATRGTSKRSRSVVRRGLVAMGDPEVVDVTKLRQFVPEPIPDDRTIRGALVTMGYESSGETRNHRYLRPKALLGHEPQSAPAMSTAGVPKPGPGPVRVIETTQALPPYFDLAEAKSEGVERVVVKSAGSNVPTEHLIGTWTMGHEPDQMRLDEVIGLTNVPDKLGLRVEVRVYARTKIDRGIDYGILPVSGADHG